MAVQIRCIRIIELSALYCRSHLLEFNLGPVQPLVPRLNPLCWLVTMLIMLNCAPHLYGNVTLMYLKVKLIMMTPISTLVYLVLLDPQRDGPSMPWSSICANVHPYFARYVYCVIGPPRDGPMISCPGRPSVLTSTIIVSGKNCTLRSPIEFHLWPVPHTPICASVHLFPPLPDSAQSYILSVTFFRTVWYPLDSQDSIPLPAPDGERILFGARSLFAHNIMNFFSQNHPT